MGANFEIYIVNKKYYKPALYTKVFSDVGKIHLTNPPMVFENLLFEKESMGHLDTDDGIQETIISGKVIQYHGNIGTHDFGLRQYYERSLYLTELWVDTEYFSDIDFSCRSSVSYSSFCQSIMMEVLSIDEENPITFFAMGLEMLVDYSCNVPKMIDESHNIVKYGIRDNDVLSVHDAF